MNPSITREHKLKAIDSTEGHPCFICGKPFAKFGGWFDFLQEAFAFCEECFNGGNINGIPFMQAIERRRIAQDAPCLLCGSEPVMLGRYTSPHHEMSGYFTLCKRHAVNPDHEHMAVLLEESLGKWKLSTAAVLN